MGPLAVFWTYPLTHMHKLTQYGGVITIVATHTICHVCVADIHTWDFISATFSFNVTTLYVHNSQETQQVIPFIQVVKFTPSQA